jgi:hypothetical protein
MQIAIWLLLDQLNLDTMYLAELQAMLANTHLDQLYSLERQELTLPESFLETEI